MINRESGSVSSMDESKVCGAVVVLAILALAAIRYVFEGRS